MSQVLAGVNQRTRLVGHNRLEILLFRLSDAQVYGINVFKVREVVMPCPHLTHCPGKHPANLGITNMRGKTISVIDLQAAVGRPALPANDSNALIVAEFSKSVQGFLVAGVERIVNTRWEDIKPAPAGMGEGHFLTAVTHIDDKIVEIIDVEKILFHVTGVRDTLDQIDNSSHGGVDASNYHVLIVDDSAVARKQIERAIKTTGVSYSMAADGQEGLEILQRWANENSQELKRLCMVISDVEMPRMDGYTMTGKIRNDPRLADLFIVLHTSLSGVLDSGLVEQVKANRFLAKYNGKELADVLWERVKVLAETRVTA